MASHLQGSALAPAWLLMVYAISLQSLVIRRVRANDRDAAVAWWLGGALVVGTGIWASSFLGLVALKVPIKIGYVRDVVMASWLPAVVVSAMALWLQTHAGAAAKLRAMGILLVAMGLCMLLFVNASSIMIQPGLTWDGGTLLGAVLGAVLINYAKSLISEQLPETWLFIQGGLFLLVVTALPDGVVGWWCQGGPMRLLAMVGWPPRTSTYPGLDLDPAVMAEKRALSGQSTQQPGEP